MHDGPDEGARTVGGKCVRTAPMRCPAGVKTDDDCRSVSISSFPLLVGQCFLAAQQPDDSLAALVTSRLHNVVYDPCFPVSRGHRGVFFSPHRK